MGSGGNLPVGPGIWGFIAFFVLAISLWLLVRNMNSRLRRMAYRDRDEAAARAEADGAAKDTAQDTGHDAGQDARQDAEQNPELDPSHDAPVEGGAAADAPGDDRPKPHAD